MEQVIFIVIACIVGFLQWLSKRAQENDSEPSEPYKTFKPTPPVTRRRPLPAESSEEERMRKFLEAMGLPTDSLPPSPPQRPPVQEVQPPVQQPQSPSLPRRSAPIRRAPRHIAQTSPAQSRPAPVQQPSQAARTREPISPPPVPALLIPQETNPAFEVNLAPEVGPSDPGAKKQSPVSAPSGSALPPLARLLRQPEDLRTAFVLKEILGTPRGLQP